MNENRKINQESEAKELEPIVLDGTEADKTTDETADGSSFGERTVFIAGEDYDEDKPFLMEGFDEKKAKKRKSKKEKKPKSTYKKQRNFAYSLIASILILSILCGAVITYVNIEVFTDPSDGAKYYAKKTDNPDYDPTDKSSLKKIYCLYDKDDFILDVTPDGYYSTEAGTLVDVDEETGKCEVVAAVYTEGNETIGSLRRVLMFPYTPKADISSIEVHNDHGTYTFYRDKDDSFQIKGYDGTEYNPELFSSLVVSTGYTLTMRKIDGPIKDENGKFSEYGLIPETRVDKDGKEYAYEPAWYILTDNDGTKHKVIVGDMLVTEGGYYVQYVELVKGADGNYLKDENGNYVEKPREAVYVVNTTIGETVLASIEELVTPRAIYPMSMNDYFDVKDFQIFSYDYSKYDQTGNEDDVTEKLVIDFSYIPIDERLNTERSSTPYIINKNSLGGYEIDDISVDYALQSLYNLTYLKVHQLGIGENTLERFTLDEPRYMLSYTFNCADDDTGEVTEVPNLVLISKKTENGTYYLASPLYNMVVEVDASQLMFLEYGQIDWIKSDMLSLNIGFCTGIKLESPKSKIDFIFDNSASDQTDGVNSDSLVVTIKKDGFEVDELHTSFTITDTKGFKWVIGTTDLKAYDSSGTEVSIKDIRRALNRYDKVTKYVEGWVTDAKGNSISIGVNTVTLKDSTGNTTEFSRNDMYNFRKFYTILLYASISGEVTTEATEEEIAAIKAQDDSLCQLKMTITTQSGRELVYRFYKLTDRKSFMTINGEGNFFVLRTLVDKIISDADRVISSELVDPEGKY